MHVYQPGTIPLLSPAFSARRLPLSLPLSPAFLSFPQVAGIPAEDFVYISFANAALGATPYIIALHRWARAAADR